MREIAIVTPCLNEEESVKPFWEEVCRVVAGLKGYHATVIFVDDGSTDSTWLEISRLTAQKHCAPRGVRLTRNFGHQNALLAGMVFAKDFDAVITLDVDLQDPPEKIPDMLSAWNNGVKVVTGVRISRPGAESKLKTSLSAGFYRLLGTFSTQQKTALSRDAGDFRLLDRQVLSELLQFEDQDLYLRGMVPWLGYSEESVTYERALRQRGVTKFSLRKMLAFATGPLLQAVARPIITFLATISIVSVLAALAILAYVLVSLGSDNLESGWASTVLVVTFFGAMNLIGVALVGLLVVRIFLGQQRRPRFVVDELTAFDEDSGRTQLK